MPPPRSGMCRRERSSASPIPAGGVWRRFPMCRRWRKRFRASKPMSGTGCSWRRKWRNGDAWCARPILGWASRRRPSVTNVHGSECLAGKGAMRGEDLMGRSCLRNYATAIRLNAAQGTMPMIDLYYWTTPNGHKITIFLEETGLPYNIMPVNIGKGEQFKAEFLAISPNNRIPALIDRAPAGGGKPITVFESGAMLLYLAEKTSQFLSRDPRARIDAIQWLFWQMGNLGPMAGQNNHFSNYEIGRA